MSTRQKINKFHSVFESKILHFTRKIFYGNSLKQNHFNKIGKVFKTLSLEIRPQGLRERKIPLVYQQPTPTNLQSNLIVIVHAKVNITEKQSKSTADNSQKREEFSITWNGEQFIDSTL